MTDDGPLPKSVLARGATLLRACGDSGTALTLAELALRTGLPKPTAHRLIGELVLLAGALGVVHGTLGLGHRARLPYGGS
ncbi:helix-turn-helix domain-containing protein [Streptomyces sp. NPDC021056]|uniref:helix-turn-helix domain-containing protein n=1 Tax=Streptomyces sp. NPDC021056 TaxID=3155012 RepID=UPI0033D3E2C5